MTVLLSPPEAGRKEVIIDPLIPTKRVEAVGVSHVGANIGGGDAGLVVASLQDVRQLDQPLRMRKGQRLQQYAFHD
jgi:hypothetical protein